MKRGIEYLLGIPYERRRGPDKVRHVAEAWDWGANCQVIVREALRELGFERPIDTRSLEIQSDASLTVPADGTQPGDVYVLERHDGQDPRDNHVAINSGLVDRRGKPLLLHGTNRGEGVSTLWTPEQFEPYYRIKVIKRVVVRS